MKKLLSILLMLMLMTAFISVALADEAEDEPQENPKDDQDSEPDDNETEHEIQIMNTTLGAEIRLLQLEKAILTNLIKGTMIVEVLQGLGVNTTLLEPILADLRDVLAEVRAANASANNSVQIFIALKNETRNLTAQFRGTLRTLLDHNTIQAIKEQLRNMNNSELQNCSKKIQNRIRQFNRNQLYRLYGLVGEANMTEINDYLNGNVTLEQVTQHLHSTINHMTKEKQNQLFSELKEDNIKKTIRAHNMFKDAKHHGKGHGNQE